MTQAGPTTVSLGLLQVRLWKESFLVSGGGLEMCLQEWAM